MIYKYRDNDFSGVNGFMFARKPGLDKSVPFYAMNIGDAVETMSIVKFREEAPTLTIEYSTDKTNWSTLGTTSTTALTYTLNPGDVVFLRCKTTAWCNDASPNNFNNITGVSKIGGNIMSLLYGNSFTGNETTFRGSTRQFESLNKNGINSNTTLKDAYDLILPATTLAERCYCNMFYGCTRLTKVPELPATTMVSGCYMAMFRGCSVLSKVPVLPATTLADYCYANMFTNCTLLRNAPELPATTLAEDCYGYMFSGCTRLTTAPELPATTLAKYCYSGMFNGCSNLNYIKCLATNMSATGCTNLWVEGVASTGIFYKNYSAHWSTGVNGIPEGWRVY